LPEPKEDQAGKPVSPVTPQSPKPGELPKEGFFEPGTLNKWMSELNLFGDPAPAKTTPKPAPAAGEDDCPGCPKKTAAAPTSGSEEPFAVIKVDGKDIPVKSREELIALAQQGHDYTRKRQRDSETERDLEERERSLMALADPLNTLVEHIKSGKPLLSKSAKTEDSEEEAPFGDEEEEEIEDPVARKKLQEAGRKLKVLEDELSQVREERNIRTATAAASGLEELYNVAAKEHPIENVIDDETKANLSFPMVAGYISMLNLREEAMAKQDPKFRRTPVPDLIKRGVRDFSRFQVKLRGSTGATALNVDVLSKDRPDLVEEIGKIAVAAYVEGRQAFPKIVRPAGAGGAAFEKKTAVKRQIKGTDDAIDQALEDPEVIAGLEEMARSMPHMIGLPND